jgi:GntR family transcriptional repressor for pyruvate dehydrogenase complex
MDTAALSPSGRRPTDSGEGTGSTVATTTPGRRPASAGGRTDARDGLSFQIEPITRIADRVAEQIRKYIIEEGLAEGDRLPSERQLAEQVGSSRLTVSQALRQLALQGLVNIRPGAGAFVLRNPASMVDASVSLMLRLEPDSLGEAAHMRFLLELTAGRQAIAHPGGDLGALDRALADLSGARGSAAEWIAADTVFHTEIARLAGNRFLTSMFAGVHTSVVGQAYAGWVTAKKPPRWLTGAAFQEQIALHEPMAKALAGGRRAEFDRAAIAHQRALLSHLGIDLPGWDQGI